MLKVSCNRPLHTPTAGHMNAKLSQFLQQSN